jgi:hypothetical protein
VEESGEELDLPTTGAELPLPAAVRPDAVLLAVVVGGEETLDRAEPRRLHVHGAGRPGQGVDVLDGVDHGIPGHPIAVGLKHGRRLVGQRGVLDPGVGQRLRDSAIQVGVGGVVDDRADVVALEVDGVHGARAHELRDELVRPLGSGVELEPEIRVEASPGEDSLQRRG